jgi:hypothetical protein
VTGVQTCALPISIGVDPALCNGKLTITDNNLTGFAEAVKLAADYHAGIPDAYFRHFYWGNIAAKAAAFIKNDQPEKI